MKKLALTGFTLLAALTLTACGSNSSKDKTTGKPENAAKVDSSKKANTEIPTSPDKDWFYNKDKDVYYAGDMTMTFGKTEVVKGMGDNKKVLVIHAKVRNNSKEDQDPSDFYMYLDAKQKTDTSNVDLTVGMVDYDFEKGNPYRQQVDNLHNDILPGKTVDVVLTYELENDSAVTLEMRDDGLQKMATKEIEVK